MRRFPAILLIPLCLAILATAQVEVSPGIQAITFSKIFTFVKTLRNRPHVEVTIVSGNAAAPGVKAIADAFRRELTVPELAGRYGVQVSSPEALPQHPSAICYLVADADAAAGSAYCARNRILTITGSLDLVKNGSASLFVGTMDNKVKIVVNLARLRQEGHELSAELLTLPKVTIIR